MVPIIGHIPLGLNSALELLRFLYIQFLSGPFFNPFYFPIWQLEHTTQVRTGKLNRCDKEPGNPFVVKNGVNVPHAHVNKCISIPNTSVCRATTTYAPRSMRSSSYVRSAGGIWRHGWHMHPLTPTIFTDIEKTTEKGMEQTLWYVKYVIRDL